MFCFLLSIWLSRMETLDSTPASQISGRSKRRHRSDAADCEPQQCRLSGSMDVVCGNNSHVSFRLIRLGNGCKAKARHLISQLNPRPTKWPDSSCVGNAIETPSSELTTDFKPDTSRWRLWFRVFELASSRPLCYRARYYLSQFFTRWPSVGLVSCDVVDNGRCWRLDKTEIEANRETGETVRIRIGSTIRARR